MSEAVPHIFRFAPSPNGLIHLGHAYSALINQQICREVGGIMLLRIEDIDTLRCTPELASLMLEDLAWLGFEWDFEPLHQSNNFDVYQDALNTLHDAGLIYPSFLTRGEIKKAVQSKKANGEDWKTDPDGVPHYPGNERSWSPEKQDEHLREQPVHTWRLNMKAAMEHAGEPLIWKETGFGWQGESGKILADPSQWGDVVLARSDTPTSYHLSSVLDDGAQNITHVVRGRDLFHATAVHRLLQTLLGLPVPTYHHHDLIMGDDGRKLSKSKGDTSIRALRDAGVTPNDIKSMIGL